MPKTSARATAAVLVTAATLSGCVSQPPEPLPRPTAAETLSPSPLIRLSAVPQTVVPILAEIEARSGNESLAVLEGAGELYLSSQHADTVTVIDTSTHRVDIIACGQDPADVLADPMTGLVYVSDNNNRGTGGVTVIDADTHGVVSRIELPGTRRAWRMALDSERHRLFITSNDGRVSVIDTQARRVIGSIKVDPNPDGVAVESDEGLAYVSDDGGIAVIDVDSLRIVDRVEAGGPGRLTVDDDAGLLFAANSGMGMGTVTVFETATLDVVRRINTVYPSDQWGPWQVILDIPARRAYVTGGIDFMTVIDLDRLEVVETLAPSADSRLAFGIYAAVDPSTDSVFVTSWWPENEADTGFIHVIERRP